MTSLFSSFDPSTIVFSLNWVSIFLGTMLLPCSFWLIPSRLNMLWINLTSTLHKEFKLLIGHSNFKGSTIIFIGTFIMILMSNFMGLFPYIFTSTSHMVITLSLALPLWLTFMMKGWLENTTHMLAHLVPQGTPSVLMPFMVCIESISNIIRPGTLAIRLSANMIAGHLLLTLLGSMGPKLGMIELNLLIIAQLLLLTLELAVSIIQSYVFTVLSVLYSSEVN
uniref:ATP synthase subunit a n=1 Tax=Callispa bowringii TaxID=2558238 RepID=A0A482JJJ7_9CUCU|nr:ATP synthase F0 subunit 6 [Callispa bowringii]QBP33861.1 ATP synthase F0 subunit 6 [Callispa bowringii]